MKRLLNAQGGVVKTFHSEAGGTPVVNTFQDCQAIIDQNREEAKEGGWSPSRELRKKASIPLVVMQQWYTEAQAKGIPWSGEDWKKFVAKKLDDSDNAYFLTAPKKTRFRVARGD